MSELIAAEGERERLRREAKDELERRYANERGRYYEPNGRAEEFIKLLDHAGARGEGITIFILRAGNSFGKTAIVVNLVNYLGDKISNKCFDSVPYLRDFKRPNRGRICTTANAAKNTYAQEIPKWFSRNKYKGLKRGREFESHFTFLRTSSEFDIFTFDQDPESGESITLDWAIVDEPMSQRHFAGLKSRLRFGGIIVFILTPLEGSGWYSDVFETPERLGQDVFVLEGSSEDNCFEASTEILTSKGWRCIRDVEVGEGVVAVGADLVPKIESVCGTVCRLYVGEMISYGSRFPLATPDHRMVTFSPDRGQGRRAVSMPEEIRPAKALRRGLRMSGHVKPLGVGYLSHNPFPSMVSQGDWAEFIGWYVAEGSSSGTKSGDKRGHYIYISQNPGAKRDRIRALLKRTAWKWAERRGEFLTKSRELHDHLFPLGTSAQKRLPRYLFSYPQEHLERLWKALLDGDGDGERRYVTISEYLADDIQELLIRMGYRATIGKWNTSLRPCKMNGKEYATRDQFCVYLNESRYYHVDEVKRVDSNMYVACVTVPSGRIIVRHPQFKRPLVTGNCITHGIRGIIPHSALTDMWADFGEDELSARRDGKFIHLSGVIYKNYRDDDGGHVLKELPPYYADCWNKKLYTLYMAVDPHDRKPFMISWTAVFPDSVAITIAEWPDDSMRPFHKIKSFSWDVQRYTDMILATEKRIGKGAEVRLVDPNFGPSRKIGGASVLQQFIDNGLRNWRLPPDSISDGHLAVKALLGDPGTGVKPAWYVMEWCKNMRWGIAHYMYHEYRDESKGLSEVPELKNKDAADLLRYKALWGLRYLNPALLGQQVFHQPTKIGGLYTGA